MGYHSSLFQNGPFYFSSPPAFFNLYDTGCCRKSSFSNAQLQYCFLAKGGQLRKQLLTEGLAARSRKIITEAKTSSYSQTPTLGVWQSYNFQWLGSSRQLTSVQFKALLAKISSKIGTVLQLLECWLKKADDWFADSKDIVQNLNVEAVLYFCNKQQTG